MSQGAEHCSPSPPQRKYKEWYLGGVILVLCHRLFISSHFLFVFSTISLRNLVTSLRSSAFLIVLWILRSFSCALTALEYSKLSAVAQFWSNSEISPALIFILLGQGLKPDEVRENFKQGMVVNNGNPRIQKTEIRFAMNLRPARATK